MSDVLSLFQEQERNRQWFEENREKLVEKYEGNFIAIYEQTVVDFDEDMGRLTHRVEKKYPPERVTVEYVTGEKLQLIL